MSQNFKYVKRAALGIFLSSIPATFNWNSDSFISHIVPVWVWWMVYCLTLYNLWKISDWNSVHVCVSKYWKLLIFVNFLYAIFFQAETYWDYKSLFYHTFVFLLPYVVIGSFSNPDNTSYIFRFWFRNFWILILILSPFVSIWSVLRVLNPFLLGLLFFPLLSKKKKVITIMVVWAIAPTFIKGRADFLRFFIALCIGYGTSIFGHLLSKRILNFGRLCFIFLPYLFFILGVTGTFNIFEGFKGQTEDMVTDELISQDTRTFLYEDVLKSAKDNNYIIQGRSMARGYDTTFMTIEGQRNERSDCEVCILNIFNSFGVMGVLLFSIIFAFASNLAINKSNNKYIQWIGVYVSFRFAISFIEEYTVFEMNWIVLWVLVALCYSPYFRNMSNNEFETWVKSI